AGAAAAAHAGGGPRATNGALTMMVTVQDIWPAGSFDDTNRQTIAVLADFQDNPDGTQFATIDKPNKIFLTPGTGFSVMDGNACDGDGAVVELPANVSTTYEVFVRLVGQPNSSIDVSTCAVDATGALTGTLNTVL